MGLYDNYKISLSNTVKPFAGSVVPELREMKKEMDTAAFKTLDLNLSTQDLLATTPTLDIDKDAYNSLNDEVQTKLDDITNKGDLANSVVDAYNLAHSATRRLNSLASRQKTMEEFKGKLAQAGYTPDVQEYLIHKTEKVNGPATFDPRTQRAQPLVPVTPAKQLKDDEILREGVIQVVKSKQWKVTENDLNSVTFDKDKNSYKISTSTGIEEIPAEDLKNQVDRLFNIKPEWRQSIQQDSESDAYHAHKNISEEQAQAEINNPTTSYGKRAQELQLKEKMTAKDALEKAASEQIQMNKVQAFKDYVGGAATRDITLSTATGTTTVDKEATAAKKSKEDSYLAGFRTGTTAPTSIGIQTSKDLTTKISKYNTDIANLDTEIAKANRDLQSTDPTTKINAASKLQVLTAEKAQLEDTKTQVMARNAVILNEEAQALKGKSWEELKREPKNNIKKELIEAGVSESDAESISEGLVSGNFTKKDYVTGMYLHPEYTINNKTWNEFLNGVPIGLEIEKVFNKYGKDLKQVIKSAENKKAKPDNVQDAAIPIIGEMRTSLGSTLSNATFYALDNETNMTSEALKEGNLNTAQVTSYNPRLERLTVQTDNGTYYATAGNYIKEMLGNDLLSLDNKSLKQLGRNLIMNNTKLYERALSKGSDILKTHPASNGKPISVQGKQYGIKRVSDDKGTRFHIISLEGNDKGQIVSIPISPDDPTKTQNTFTFPEIETILNNTIPK